MISLDKKYRTRDGRQVRLYAVDGRVDGDSVHGAFLNPTYGWHSAAWKADGRYFHRNDDGFDLVEVKAQHEGWINIYPEDDEIARVVARCSSGIFQSKNAADDMASKSRVACLRIEWEA